MYGSVGGFMDGSKKKLNVLRALILIIALAMVGLGIFSNGYNDVKNKAIRICYECMGIG